jgi:spore germination protein
MRRVGFWIPVGALAALGLALWGLWTYRLGVANTNLALALEAQRQRSFSEMAYHVEEIQALLGKGLVAGTTRQNMRYMGDVQQHAQAAVSNFTSLPLPAQVSAGAGKFLQQVGDFATSVLRNEAAGRELDGPGRTELARLRTESAGLSAQLQKINTDYSQGGFRWNPPVRFSWGALMRGPGGEGKPGTQDQAPASMVSGGWEQVGATMDKLPTMVYDGPFSDHVGKQNPAVSGPPVTPAEAESRMRTYLPNAQGYRRVDVTDLNGNIPAYSFRLAPATAPAPAGGTAAWTTTVEVTKNGGYLLDLLNSRMAGLPALDLGRAKALGQSYLESGGYKGMVATYGQAMDGTATIAYAFQENGVLIYPDQIKVKVALDNGEILAVDARQYLMFHHVRTLGKPSVTAREAEDQVNPDLAVQRVQLAVIPNLAGTGEILAYEFLGTMDGDTYLVYINAETGAEEQILQQVQTDGGTFAL